MMSFEYGNTEPVSTQVGVSQLRYSSNNNLKCILGSCVSVVLFSDEKEKTFSSMSHYLLARHNPGTSGLIPDENKFGDILIEKQLQGMFGLISERHLKAMVFGGATLKNYMKAGIIADIGEKNIDIAQEKLNRKNIEVVARDVGGDTARYVEFNPLTKTAVVTQLKNNNVFFYALRK